MELVPVPGSGSEMILDHHLAFSVALECVVPSIEIEKKTLQQKRSNTSARANTLSLNKDRIAPADTCQHKRAARNEPAETRRQKRAGTTFERHKQCNYE